MGTFTVFGAFFQGEVRDSSGIGYDIFSTEAYLSGDEPFLLKW